MLVPMVLLLVQMAMRYEWRPLQQGESTVLVAHLKAGTPQNIAPLTLEAPGLTVEAGKNRSYLAPTKEYPERNSVEWRIRARDTGRHDVQIRVGNETAHKIIDVAANRYAGVNPLRPGGDLEDVLFYPRESPAAAGAVIQKIELQYPENVTPLFGWEIHWVISYFILSMIIALAVKPILKVKI
jgi:hypothetical protein